MLNFWHRADKTATIGKNWSDDSDTNVIFDRISGQDIPWFQRLFARQKKRKARRKSLWSHWLQIPLPHLIRFRI
jgi:hypothetical protein